MRQLLLIFFLLLCFSPKAQTDQNSLWALWGDDRQHDTIRLQAMNDLLWKFYLFSKPDSAFLLAQLEYDFAEQKGEKIYCAQALNSQGLSFYNRGDLAKALEYALRALAINEEMGNKKAISSSVGNIGLIYYNLGEYDKASEYFSKSLHIKEESGDLMGIGNTLNNIANIHRDLGEYTAAIDLYTRSLAIREEIGHTKGIATNLGNLGVVWADQGDNAKALEYQKRNLDLTVQLGDKTQMVNAIINIGLIYLDQGDLANAVDYFNQGKSICEEIGDKRGLSMAIINLGQVHQRQNNLDSAENFFIQALKLSEEVGEKKGIANAYSNIGNVYHVRGESEKAIDYCMRSMDIWQEMGSKGRVGLALNGIGAILTERGDSAFNAGNPALAQEIYANAIEFSTEAYDLVVQAGTISEIQNTLISLYIEHIRIGNQYKAWRYLEKLKYYRLNEINTNYFTLSEGEKEKYFATMEQDFGKYYDFTSFNENHFSGLLDTAYNIALQIKGITLKSSFAMRSAVLNSGDSTLISDYEKWMNLERKLSTRHSTENDRISDVSSTAELEKEANEPERKLIKESVAFGDFDRIKHLDWKQVQSSLKPSECAIEFVHFKSEIDRARPVIYAAILIKPESEHPQFIRLCQEGELIEILDVPRRNSHDFVQSLYGSGSDTPSQLYEKIWKPIDEQLSGVKTIFYTPSGLLHKISFATLSKGTDEFLSDDYHFKQLSSTGNLVFSRYTDISSDDSFLLMGGVNYSSDSTPSEIWPFLPGSLEETDQIEGILKNEKFAVNYFSDGDASEEKFKEHISGSGIVHLATHGYFYPDPDEIRAETNPGPETGDSLIFRGSGTYANWSFVNNKNPMMRSGLVLAGANNVWQRNALQQGEDGILTAQEVSHLDLSKTKLVVLSACETGLGDIKGSEGVYGLQRAFKMAGVKYIIMSLWQVPDKETAEFMTTFYKNLTKTNDIRKSFNLTQRTMREKYDPYYWGAFVLIE